MADFKNTTVNDTGAINIPVGTSAQRPGEPGQPPARQGMIRYNTTESVVEFYVGLDADPYDAANWEQLGQSGTIGTELNPAPSAQAILATGNTTDGVYWIKPSAGTDARQVYCILDPNWDGGGWMIISNNSAQGNIYTTGHVPRVTAWGPHVGSNGADSTTSTNNFTIDMTDVSFTDLAHVAYDNATMNFKDYLAYMACSFNNEQTLPNSQDWLLEPDSSGFVITGLNDRRLYDSSNNSDTIQSIAMAFGRNDAGVTVRVNGDDADTPYPVWIHSRTRGQNVPDYDLTRTFSFGEYLGRNSDVGWDDFQDGSGMGDTWGVRNVGVNAYRGYPSFVMVR